MPQRPGSRARPGLPDYVRLDGLTVPAWVPATPTWQRAFALAAGPAPETSRCFIHRDYHHGNTLWSRGRLTGVVDWNQASWGGPGPVDLGHMRWNLALDYGIQAAEQFLAIYRTLTAGAVRHHPYLGRGYRDRPDRHHRPRRHPLPSGDLAALETYVAAALAHL